MKRLLSVVIAVATCSMPLLAQRPDIRQDIRNAYGYDASAFTFTRTNGQGASGSLTNIGSNVVTLSPCPSGVNGSNQNHYVWLSGGTGTAEAVKIAGGTCTSGAASGTIIIGTAYAHSGSWTITSVADGIPEALQAARATRGTVFLTARAGGYEAKAHAIVMPEYTGLQCGDGESVYRNNDSSYIAHGYVDGCTLKITGASGSLSGQTIMVKTGGRIRGLNFYYPSQQNDPTPLVYPPTIRLDNTNYAVGVLLENLYSPNTYIFVDAQYQHGRLHIDGLRGQPLHRGIIIDRAYDVDLIENVLFIGPTYDDSGKTYTYPDDSTAQYYIARTAFGIDIYGADWVTLNNVRMFGYYRGLNLDGSHVQVDTNEPRGSYGSATGFLCDSCQFSLFVSQNALTASGWKFTNSGFSGLTRYTAGNVSTAIFIDDSAQGPITFVNCEASGYSGAAVKTQSGAQSGSVAVIATDSAPIYWYGGLIQSWGNYVNAPAVSLTGSGTFVMFGGKVKALETGGGNPEVFVEYADPSFTGKAARLYGVDFVGSLTFFENAALFPTLRTQLRDVTDSTGLRNTSDSVGLSTTIVFSALGTPANGTVKYCSDCTAASSPCSSGGSGALAVRQAGAWKCF